MHKTLLSILVACMIPWCLLQPASLRAAEPRDTRTSAAARAEGNGNAQQQQALDRVNQHIQQALQEDSGKLQGRQVEPGLSIPGGYSLGVVLAVLAAALLLAGTAGHRWSRGNHRGRRRSHRLNPQARPPRPVADVAPVAKSPAPAAELAKAAPVPVRQPAGITVEQIDGIVDEARVIVALGRTGNAIKLLNDHVDLHPHSSVNAWLYLLELYRNTDNKKAFTDLGQRMHAAFNIMVPPWDAGKAAALLPLSLEEFPHVMQKVIDGWGTQGCLEYLRKLLQDNREGERTGFSVAVFQEVSLLLAILEHRERP